MCKIILKFDALTVDDIEGHREDVEKGAGIVWYDRGRFNIVKDMTHIGMYQQYYDKYLGTDRMGYAPFALFHSRMPSEGTVSYQNIQPFISESIAFCHNGTIAIANLMWLNAGMQNRINGDESDSLLLFKILRKNTASTSCALLKEIDQNFVLCNLREKRIYVIGHFDIVMTPDKSKLLSARNKWGGEKIFIETDFEGNIKRIVRSAPVKYFYRYDGYAGDFKDKPKTKVIDVTKKDKGKGKDGKNGSGSCDSKKQLPLIPSEDGYWRNVDIENLRDIDRPDWRDKI